MLKPSSWNPKLGIVSLGGLMVCAHFVLVRILSNYDIVSIIFAAGNHVPVWMVSLAAIFVAIRFFVLVLLPALLVWRAILWLGSRLEIHRRHLG